MLIAPENQRKGEKIETEKLQPPVISKTIRITPIPASSYMHSALCSGVYRRFVFV